MSLGLSLGLGLSAARAVAGAPAAAISTFEVLGPTVLPDGADAAIPNGWVAKITLPYDAGATFDPSKILLTVQDPGFDGSGAVTRTRFIQGGKIVRLQYPNGASNHYTNAAGVASVYFSLEDHVYSGSTVVGVQAASGFYGTAQAGAVSSITNSSTRAYPIPLVAWSNMQQVRATGSYAVELYVAHRHAMNGRAVARVEFIGTDGTNFSATQTATTPALSGLITGSFKPEVYKASIPLTALNQASLSTDICTVNAIVYPWLGTSYNLSTSGTAWPTANPDTLLRFTNDKNGTYGGAHVAVQVGAAGGTVQASYASALTTPYPTINAALAAVQTWNNANKGHNDHSGATIWLMETTPGAGASHSLAAAVNTVAVGSCWTDIKVDPAATGSVGISIGVTRAVCSLLHWQANITQAGSFAFDGNTANGNVMAAYSGLTLNAGAAGTPVNYRCGLTWMRNVTATAGLSNSNGNPFFSGFTATRTQCVSILGCTITATANMSMAAGFVAGNSTQRVRLAEYGATFTLHDTLDGMILANNLCRNMQQATTIAEVRALTKGLVLIQNVIERAVVGSSPALQVGADNTTNPVDNVVVFHNTIPGGITDTRYNGFYTDVAGAVGVQKKGVLKFNILSQYNCKTDTFTTNTVLTGRTGNWERIYTVGDDGNVTMIGSASGNTTPGYAAPTGNWLGEYWKNTSATNALKANVPFTNDQAGGVGAVGLGTYTLTGPTNSAYGRVSSGSAVLAYDIAGNARLNNGNGAAGAYER